MMVKCPKAGTISQRKTLQEAHENPKKVTELYLEEFPQKTPVQ